MITVTITGKDYSEIIAQLRSISEGKGNPNYNMSVTAISRDELSMRGRRTLLRLGLKTLGDIADIDRSTLWNTRNVGAYTIGELVALLKKHGIAPRQDLLSCPWKKKKRP